MGGICGFIGSRSFKSAVGAETNRGQHVDVYLTAPMQKLRHRGPDGHGYSTNNHSYFGHTRLAIHDAPNGRQPIYNENGSLLSCWMAKFTTTGTAEAVTEPA